MVKMNRSVRSSRPSSSIARRSSRSASNPPAAFLASSTTTVSNSSRRPYAAITARVSTSGSPASPRTSVIAPSPSPCSSGWRTSSKTTLSPGFAFFECGSRTMTGSRRSVPSGSMTQLRPRFLSVPANVDRPRSRISSTRPTTPRRAASAAPRPRNRWSARRKTRQRTRSPLMASSVSPGGMKRSPSRQGVAGRTKANPRAVTLITPSISSP